MAKPTGRLTFTISPSAYVGLVLFTVLFLQAMPQDFPRAITYSVLLFATVVLHEFGHAGVALVMGLAPVRIQVHVLGGVTSYARRRPSPGRDALIAVAGPAVTLVLYLFANAALSSVPDQWFATVEFWRNACLLLTVFNLLPGLPLDGGALVKSAAWAVVRDERKAIRFAAACGLLVAAGIVGCSGWLTSTSGDRVSLGIGIVLAATIGGSAWQTWKAASPAQPGPAPVEPSH